MGTRRPRTWTGRREASGCSPGPSPGPPGTVPAGPGSPPSGSAAPTPTPCWRKPRPVTRCRAAGRLRPAVTGPGPGKRRGGGRGGLAGQAGRLAAWVAARPEADPADVAWSLVSTRARLEHRAVVTGGSREDLVAGLGAVAAGGPSAGVVCGVAGGEDPGRVVFVFPGQGGQWAGMGRELAAGSPVFAARLAECSGELAAYADWPLNEGLGGDRRLDRADVVQPALWAVMVSLAAVWQAAGITPRAAVGHSQGEIAAAVVAGVLSLEDGAKVVALRSQALVQLAGTGGMMSLAQPAEAVQHRLAAA